MNIKENYERLMLFFALLVQFVGFIISITIEDFSKSFLPYANHIVPPINFTGICLALFMLIFPRYKFLQSIVFFTFGILMTLNNLVFLGALLYSLGLVLMFANGLIEQKPQRKLIIIDVIWFLSLFSLIPQNIFQFFMALVYSLFLVFAYAHIYTSMRKYSLSLFPITSQNISSKELPQIGSELRLKDLGFTDRQSKIAIEFSKNHSTYKELADWVYTSESTIKHEMKEIFTKIGVQNSIELGFLLSMYKISD